MAKKTQNKRKPSKKSEKKKTKKTNNKKSTNEDEKSDEVTSILETLSNISPMFSFDRQKTEEDKEAEPEEEAEAEPEEEVEEAEEAEAEEAEEAEAEEAEEAEAEEAEAERLLNKTCHIDLAIGTKGDKTYEKIRKEGMPTFVRVHARWCGHCQELEPVWNELKEWHEKNMKNKNSPLESILLLSVEDTELDRAKEKYPELNADGYPSLMMVRNGRVQNEFQGPRSLPSLKTFVMNQANNMRPKRYRGGKSKKSSRRKSTAKTHRRRRKKQHKKSRNSKRPSHRRRKRSRRL